MQDFLIALKCVINILVNKIVTRINEFHKTISLMEGCTSDTLFSYKKTMQLKVFCCNICNIICISYAICSNVLV